MTVKIFDMREDQPDDEIEYTAELVIDGELVVKVYAPSPEKRETFVQTMASLYGGLEEL